VLSVLKFAKKEMDESNRNFPLFFMGNSINTFMKLSISNEQVPLNPMNELRDASLQMRLLK